MPESYFLVYRHDGILVIVFANMLADFDKRFRLPLLVLHWEKSGDQSHIKPHRGKSSYNLDSFETFKRIDNPF
ncbi:hypothetical protein TNCT_9271 [Trichonephila clavata]|uniref:Uncharacterized protein n=1 Tax=Trichonephila clavata TaxID=2740835 RepID=A0A8X6GZB7_TRICU|nr:hypothetical protein TNCT_9271 [Trichonephila clavata]